MNAPRSDTFSSLCGAAGLLGCLGLIAGDVGGIIANGRHNPISETLSQSAIGEYSWILDTGLGFFAAGAIACGMGFLNWNAGGFRWKTLAVLLVVFGVDVVLVAQHNQYAGRDVQGAAAHFYYVCILGVIFTLSQLLLAFELRPINERWFRYGLGLAAAWIIAGPLYFLVPPSWDGAYERFLGIFVIVWFAAVSCLLLKRGREGARFPHTQADDPKL